MSVGAGNIVSRRDCERGRFSEVRSPRTEFMLRALVLAQCLALSAALMAPVGVSRHPLAASKIAMQHGGKGFGGGEATRDPEPTAYDPNDPKGKQQAIHKAESFAEYLAKRGAGGGASEVQGTVVRLSRSNSPCPEILATFANPNC